MRTISGIVSRRHAVVAVTGAAAVFGALVGSPAHAFVTPSDPNAGPNYASGTLALCVGAEQGATTYVYAEPIAAQGNKPNPDGMDHIPSQLTQLIAGPMSTKLPKQRKLQGGLDCRAYPADPGSYEITSYKYPKVPCTKDKTRPANNPGGPGTIDPTVPKGECLARVHHIHIIHLAGVVKYVGSDGNVYPSSTDLTNGTNPGVPTTGSALTPFCAANGISPNAAGPGGGGTQATTLGNGACVASPPTGSDGYDYGIEYTGELLTTPPGVEDTIVDEIKAIVQVRKGETTEVVNHVPDHEVSECSSSFDPDVNGNTPICN